MKPILTLFFLLITASLLFAEKIHLKNGKVIEAQGAKTNGVTLIIQIQGGEIEVMWDELTEADGRKFFPKLFAEMDRVAREEAQRIQREAQEKVEREQREADEREERARQEREALEAAQREFERKQEADRIARIAEDRRQFQVLEQNFLKTLNTQKPDLEKERGKIGGGAWIERKNADSTLLRGLKIYVCNEFFGVEFRRELQVNREMAKESLQKTAQNFSQPTINIVKEFSEYMNYQLLGELMPRSKHIIAVTEADAEGKYELEIDGTARFIFAYRATDYWLILWLIPVRVEEGKTQKINLSNSNALVIINNPMP